MGKSYFKSLFIIYKTLFSRSEPYRWNEYQNKFYLFYLHFATALQAGILPAILILKKQKISFLKEMLYEVHE